MAKIGSWRDATAKLGSALIVFCVTGCQTSLPETRSPRHLRVSHLYCKTVRTTEDPATIDRFVDYLTERKDGWRRWRTTYFGVFQNAFPYAEIIAIDNRGGFLFAVGIDRKQITFRQENVQLRRKTVASEHDELLAIVGVSDALLADIIRRRVETLRLLYPVVTALDQFKNDIGRYPSNAEGINALVDDTGAPGWKGPYLAALPADAWSTPLRFYTTRYENTRRTNVFEYLWSAGHDQVFDSGKPVVWAGNDVYWTLDELHSRMRPVQARQ